MSGTVYAYTDSATFGGAEEALAILLTGLRERGWQPTLLHNGADGLEPLLERTHRGGVPDHVVAATPEGISGGMRAVALARSLRRDRPDVFHAHLTWPFGCKWALAAACAARVPAVLGTAQLFVDIPMTLSRRAQAWGLSRGVDSLIAVSEATRQRYQEALRWPPARTTVIRNAIALHRFEQGTDDAARAALDDGSGRLLALVPARLEEQKGHADLLQAARRLSGIRLLCAGDGSLRGALEAQARDLGVADRVSFLGFRSDMAELFSACDLVVLPSHYEGLPLALVEAMAAGRPVIATAVGGTGELVVDGRTGVLVEPGDPEALAAAIERLARNADLRRTYGAAGRARANEQFSAQAMIAAVDAEYRRILAAPGAAP